MSEISTIQLEFRDLSTLTRDNKYQVSTYFGAHRLLKSRVEGESILLRYSPCYNALPFFLYLCKDIRIMQLQSI